MILADSSVWIDYFRGVSSRETDILDDLLDTESLMVGDLILTEVLQGFSPGPQLRQASELFDTLVYTSLCGRRVALAAAANYRVLRSKGFTIRKTIDTMIATHCILNKIELLHNDRDFDPFEKHLGLKCL